MSESGRASGHGAGGSPGIAPVGPTAGALPVVDTPCPLCGADGCERWWTTQDRAFGVPGRFTVVQCRTCGFLYQRPRVREEHLAACYPDDYPRHQEPSPRYPLKGSAGRVRAARWALANALGYTRFADADASLVTRVRGRFLQRKLVWSCPPWRGEGRYLDVGCGSGSVLAVARALGWRTAGIEMDAVAAEKARRFADELHVGDVLSAPFAPARFDVITIFHVLEHVPDPVSATRRMLDWLAPGGLLVIEVPNVGGLGARAFGRAWSALELPRHLSHFTPGTLARTVEQAGGRVVWCRHRSKPRHHLWSLGTWLRDRGWGPIARATQWRPLYGILKLGLELTLPLVDIARRGEVIRVGVERARADSR